MFIYSRAMMSSLPSPSNSSYSSALFNNLCSSSDFCLQFPNFFGIFGCHRNVRNFVTQKSKSLYQTLGLSPTASQEEIKNAYYSLSKKYHPDVSGSNVASSQKYMEVKEAYDILRDEAKRKEYDRRLEFETNYQRAPYETVDQQFDRRRHQQTYNDWIYRVYKQQENKQTFSDEELRRIWRNMRGNPEFQQSYKDFNEEIRRRQRDTFEEQARRRNEWIRNGYNYNNNGKSWDDYSQHFTRQTLMLVKRLILIYFILAVLVSVSKHVKIVTGLSYDNQERRRQLIEEMTRRMP